MKANGFTLLELMVVVTIVAILAAIAIPSFNEQARKSRRSEALQCLSDVQLRQEKWRSNHATYGSGTNIGVPSTANYTCAVTVNTPFNHTSTATPVAGSPQAGDRCGTYTFEVIAGVLDKKFSGTAPCL